MLEHHTAYGFCCESVVRIGILLAETRSLVISLARVESFGISFAKVDSLVISLARVGVS